MKKKLRFVNIGDTKREIVNKINSLGLREFFNFSILNFIKNGEDRIVKIENAIFYNWEFKKAISIKQK